MVEDYVRYFLNNKDDMCDSLYMTIEWIYLLIDDWKRSVPRASAARAVCADRGRGVELSVSASADPRIAC